MLFYNPEIPALIKWPIQGVQPRKVLVVNFLVFLILNFFALLLEYVI